MKRSISIQFILISAISIVYMGLRPAFGAEESLVFSALEKAGGVSVEGEIFVENSFKQVQLNIESPTLNPSSLQALGFYYRYAIDNKTNEIAKLHFTGDASSEWILDELQNIPDKFSGFAKLKEVQINQKFLWGKYGIYDVSWYLANHEFAARWSEALYCDANVNCKISSFLLSGNDKNSLFFFASGQLAKGKMLQRRNNFKYKIEYYPLDIKDGLPLTISFDFQWYAKPEFASMNASGSGTRQINEKIASLFKYYGQKEEKSAPIKLIPVYSVDSKQVKFFPINLLEGIALGAGGFQLLGHFESKSKKYILAKVEIDKVGNYLILPISNDEKLDKDLYEDVVSYLTRTKEFFELLDAEVTKKQVN